MDMQGHISHKKDHAILHKLYACHDKAQIYNNAETISIHNHFPVDLASCKFAWLNHLIIINLEKRLNYTSAEEDLLTTLHTVYKQLP